MILWNYLITSAGLRELCVPAESRGGGGISFQWGGVIVGALCRAAGWNILFPSLGLTLDTRPPLMIGGNYTSSSILRKSDKNNIDCNTDWFTLKWEM